MFSWTATIFPIFPVSISKFKMNKIGRDCIGAHPAIALTQCVHQGWKPRNLNTITSFFRVVKILCLVYGQLDRRKAQKLILAFFPEQISQFMNSCSALELQLLEEGNTLGLWLRRKICGWTAHFLVKHICFYRGASTILSTKAYLPDGLIVGWRMHKQSWLLPKGGRTPCGYISPFSLLLKYS